MVYFVISGKTGCQNYTHAVHVAENLCQPLPHFRYRKIEKPESEWPSWLDETNTLNKWHETKSPVIWKEVSRMGGKAFLIGGLSEFWEYCYDYYGFQSTLSKENLDQIMRDDLLINSSLPQIRPQTIGIIGGCNHLMLEMLVYELQGCFSSGNIGIKIFDKSDDPEANEALLDIVEDLKDIVKCNPRSFSVVSSVVNVIQDTDLLIIIEDYSRDQSEDVDSWLERCRWDMLLLSDDINQLAKRDLRIVLNHHGPVCFSASVLMEYCTTIRLANIVAVTADEGISVISMLAEKTGEAVEHFWCPPVWGFSGILSHVSLSSTPITAEVIRPYKRALKTKETTSLPKGQVQKEIRFLESVLGIDDQLHQEIQEKQEEHGKVLQRQPILPKIRAIASLLKLWFAKEIGDDIIALGICSNGHYGFPPGICFSQCVALNEKRLWEPVSNIPLLPNASQQIAEIVSDVDGILQKFGLRGNYDGDDVQQGDNLGTCE